MGRDGEDVLRVGKGRNEDGAWLKVVLQEEKTIRSQECVGDREEVLGKKKDSVGGSGGVWRKY